MYTKTFEIMRNYFIEDYDFTIESKNKSETAIHYFSIKLDSWVNFYEKLDNSYHLKAFLPGLKAGIFVNATDGCIMEFNYDQCWLRLHWYKPNKNGLPPKAYYKQLEELQEKYR